MSNSKPDSLSSSSSPTAQDNPFKPYPPNNEFVQFTLDEDLEVLVLNERSFNHSEGYSDKRVVLVLREYIHSKITLDEATRAILDFLPVGADGPGAFGSCMLHTAEQIPHNHPGGQARVVQLLRSVYNFLGVAARNQLGIEIYENFEPDLDGKIDRPTTGDPLRLTLNFLAFLARLSQDGMLNMATEGIRTMRGLEGEVEDPKYADCNVSLAALWIVFSGQRKLYKGPVYGRERWMFWRDALKAAGGKEGFSMESRKLVRKAAELMDAIDTSVQL